MGSLLLFMLVSFIIFGTIIAMEIKYGDNDVSNETHDSVKGFLSNAPDLDEGIVKDTILKIIKISGMSVMSIQLKKSIIDLDISVDISNKNINTDLLKNKLISLGLVSSKNWNVNNIGSETNIKMVVKSWQSLNYIKINKYSDDRIKNIIS